MASQVFRILCLDQNHCPVRPGSNQPQNFPLVLVRHLGHRRAPIAILRRAAHRADAHVVDRSRREIGQHDSLRIRINASLLPRARARGELDLIRLRIRDRLQIHRQLYRHGIVQREHRLVQRRLRLVRVHHVEAGGQHLRQRQRHRETLHITRRLAQRGNQCVARFIFCGGRRLSALRRSRDSVLKRRLQRHEADDAYRQGGEQRICLETRNDEDCEAVQLVVR